MKLKELITVEGNTLSFSLPSSPKEALIKVKDRTRYKTALREFQRELKELEMEAEDIDEDEIEFLVSEIESELVLEITPFEKAFNKLPAGAFATAKLSFEAYDEFVSAAETPDEKVTINSPWLKKLLKAGLLEEVQANEEEKAQYLASLKAVELKELCQGRKIETKGLKKAELIERLRKADIQIKYPAIYRYRTDLIPTVKLHFETEYFKEVKKAMLAFPEEYYSDIFDAACDEYPFDPEPEAIKIIEELVQATQNHQKEETSTTRGVSLSDNQKNAKNPTEETVAPSRSGCAATVIIIFVMLYAWAAI